MQHERTCNCENSLCNEDWAGAGWVDTTTTTTTTSVSQGGQECSSCSSEGGMQCDDSHPGTITSCPAGSGCLISELRPAGGGAELFTRECDTAGREPRCGVVRTNGTVSSAELVLTLECLQYSTDGITHSGQMNRPRLFSLTHLFYHFPDLSILFLFREQLQ